jgi:ceramide glucosyltransferase
VIWLAAAIALLAGFYQLLALLAAVCHRRGAPVLPSSFVPVSILKPVYGKEAGFYEAIRSHASQQYPAGFEILFGIGRPNDPARVEVERLVREYPAVPIRLVVCSTESPNRKVGVLIDLAREAHHAILIVNDSDITVPPGYLRDVTAPLADSGVALVTCLYRAEAHDWPSRFEALAIATEFAPSTLVARLFGVSDFGLGSTLAFRKPDLERIGGFEAIADYLADDYQLGRKLHSLGLRNVISEVVVSTRLAGGSWNGAWQHQVRWARTVRLSGGAGYLGLPITFATLWAAVVGALGFWWMAAGLLAIRFAMAIACGWFVLRSADVLKYFYAIPLRDLFGAGIWCAGLRSRTVQWRDRRLHLDREGRIVGVEPR